MVGLRPLAGCALGAHASPRRVGQRAPGVATKGRTEMAQLELSPHAAEIIYVAMVELETEAAIPFLRKSGRADRQRTRGQQADQSAARGSSHGQLFRLKSAPHGHGETFIHMARHLSTPLATRSSVPHAPHVLPHCSLPSGVIGRHRAP